MSVGWWVVESGLTPDVGAGMVAHLLPIERGMVGLWLVLAMRHMHGLGWGGALWRGVLITLMDFFLLRFFFGAAAGGMEAYLTLWGVRSVKGWERSYCERAPGTG